MADELSSRDVKYFRCHQLTRRYMRRRRAALRSRACWSARGRCCARAACARRRSARRGPQGGGALKSASLPSLGRRTRLSVGSGWASVGRAGAVAGASASDCTRPTGNAGEQQPAGVCPFNLTGGVCSLTLPQCYLYKMSSCHPWSGLRRPFAGLWLDVGGAHGAFTAQCWHIFAANERPVARRLHSFGTVNLLFCAVIADG